MKLKILLILSAALLILIGVMRINLSNENFLWPEENTIIHAVKYKLDIADTSRILLNNKNSYSLINPNDSLITSRFSIEYLKAVEKPEQNFYINANLQVSNSLNPEIIEYYNLEDGNVFFAGYSTGDTSKPVIIFEPQLILSPKIDIELINQDSQFIFSTSSSALMKTFDAETNTFDEGINTKLEVKYLGTLNIIVNKKQKSYLRELVLSRDAIMSYGDRNLTIPEAILSKSKLLIDENGYPIAEWTIKTIHSEEIQSKDQKNDLYIELTKYLVQ